MDVYDLRYIACILLHDKYGINDYAWELLEEELIRQDVYDISKYVKSTGKPLPDYPRWYITEDDFVHLVVP